MKRFLNKRNALIVLTVLFLLIAWNREINLLYGMFSLLAATLAVSAILPRYSVRHLSGSRTIPATAFEGDEIPVLVELRNGARRSLHMLEVLDSVPAAEEGSRSPMTFVGKLKGRERRGYSYSLSCYKRGEYELGPLKVICSYPLGVASAGKPLQKAPVPLLVYPRVFDIARLPFLKGSSALIGLSEVVRTGGSEDFFGTREYRRGDSLRRIHWPSSARQGSLIVKEFETRSSEEVTVVLDLHKSSEIGEGRDTTLEYSIRIAASLATHIIGKGHGFQLVGYGKTNCIVPYGRGPAQLARGLDALARVKADGTLPYQVAVQRATELMREGDTAVLFYCRGNEDTQQHSECLGLLRARRTKTVAVFMNAATFSGREAVSGHNVRLAEEFAAMDSTIYEVSMGDDLEEVFGG